MIKKARRGRGAPGRPRRPGGGRKPSSVRRLIQVAHELDFGGEAVTAHADIDGFGFCPHCGAAWWEAHAVTYRQGVPLSEPDADGETFPAVATETRPAQQEQHYRSCPLHEAGNSDAAPAAPARPRSD